MTAPRTLDDWLAHCERLHPKSMDFTLDRVRVVRDRLQLRFECPVISVGGTNGKGSTCAMIESIARHAGYPTALYMSPHLVHFEERCLIDGRMADAATLLPHFEAVEAVRGDITLTYFEFTTLTVLRAFVHARPDVAILEVGLGGRLDAVNAFDADCAVVTGIALDHTEFLGPDRESIGREKAGIFRAGRPAIFGARDMPASIREWAQTVGSDLQQLGRDFDWVRSGAGWSWRGRAGEQRDLPAPALHGQIQFDNAAAVLAALATLESRLRVPRSAIERALQTVTLPGRFQVVRQTTPRAIEWILDVAHNPAAAHTLAAQLAARETSGRTIAVCGVLADKDIDGIVGQVSRSFDSWVIVGLQGARALAPDALAARARNLGVNVEAVAADVVAGCLAAEALAHAGDRIVVFGSFLTVGPALGWLYTSRPWSA